MPNITTRIGLLQFLCFAGLLTVVGRAVQLQVIEGEKWAKEAERTRVAVRSLPPRRGTIYDRQGSPLAVSQEEYRVGVAPWEVPRRLSDSVARLLVRRLDFPREEVRTAFRKARAGLDSIYLYRYTPATASQVEALRRLPGAHLTRVFRRTHPSGSLAGDLVGAVDPDSGSGRTGLERSLDSLLRGIPGEAGFLRDRRGALYESPDRLVRDPVPGHDVLLTLDAELQGIAENALAETLKGQDADAGDVVLVDPRSGEVLALASLVRRPAGVRRAGAWVPAEPGSTIKPFAAAGLLSLGRAGAGDSVYGENGEWQLEGRRRPITDTHAERGWVTLARAIQVSSNIATTKFTMRLEPREHYEILRAFGFGSPTGLEIPYESPGLLKKPHHWSGRAYTQASMAQGYELEVTPLQLAAAYAALAHDGWLPALTLIREIRDPEGRVVYRHLPTPVRRVLSADVAAEVREFLREATSEAGTGGRAQLASYRLIGKTGTARNVVGRSYAPGHYTASFAAIFPADDPQLVVVVRIVNPQAGEYYGGLVAAPLTRRMLQDALAARRSALDRRRLALGVAGDSPPPSAEPPPRLATAPVVVRVPVVTPAPARRPVVEIPDVRGMPVRVAVLLLHRRGFRVALDGAGVVRGSSPEPGDSGRAGSVVRLRAAPLE
ncbi:MAG TPA: penicillin-binding transpeptidase domain-containing protein [Gemmatimonadales bacterium]